MEAPKPTTSDSVIKILSGLTILGIMGEAPKLEMSESLAFIKQVASRAGEIPIVVGVSSPGFAAMRALARGADGVPPGGADDGGAVAEPQA